MLIHFRKLVIEKNTFERRCFFEDIYVNTINIAQISPWHQEDYSPGNLENKEFTKITTTSGDSIVIEGSPSAISEKVNLNQKGLICG